MWNGRIQGTHSLDRKSEVLKQRLFTVVRQAYLVRNDQDIPSFCTACNGWGVWTKAKSRSGCIGMRENECRLIVRVPYLWLYARNHIVHACWYNKLHTKHLCIDVPVGRRTGVAWCLHEVLPYFLGAWSGLEWSITEEVEWRIVFY
jgi:hypothetical protein